MSSKEQRNHELQLQALLNENRFDEARRLALDYWRVKDTPLLELIAPSAHYILTSQAVPTQEFLQKPIDLTQAIHFGQPFIRKLFIMAMAIILTVFFGLSIFHVQRGVAIFFSFCEIVWVAGVIVAAWQFKSDFSLLMIDSKGISQPASRKSVSWNNVLLALVWQRKTNDGSLLIYQKDSYKPIVFDLQTLNASPHNIGWVVEQYRLKYAQEKNPDPA
jgi:hypothetical protein